MDESRARRWTSPCPFWVPSAMSSFVGYLVGSVFEGGMTPLEVFLQGAGAGVMLAFGLVASVFLTRRFEMVDWSAPARVALRRLFVLDPAERTTLLGV